VSRDRERRIGTLIELKPVLPAPHPGPLPNFSMTPGGSGRGRGALFAGFHGTSRPVSSMLRRNPLGGVCAHSDVPLNPARAAPIGTARRNAE
jgi:hypothetical protein